MKSLLLIVFVVLVVAARAQEFAIKTIELTPDKVIIHYDLVDSTKKRTYTVHIYSSRDNFLAPLTKTSGDIGLEVKPGKNRKITWNSKEELGNYFEGDVELEVRGRVYIPFIRFDGFNEVKTRKRAVPFLVKWSGGTQQNILNFQLFKNDKLVYTFPNVPNTHEYKLTIPSSVKPGDSYYLKVSDSKNKDQQMVSSRFNIKRKVPLMLKALPVLALGGAAVALAGGSSSGSTDLSVPPSVPTNH
ncbi:MAG TPA: hypothetical protein VGQ59_06760 [Cyclobacteriaceae bacterium]|jgi:hypothetical protein|nr:hypothetical protein [Cyclobacteriaceae bacterium]